MPEAEHIICFHALLAGSCWVELTDRSMPAISLEAGDIVVIPKGLDAGLVYYWIDGNV